MDVVGVDGDQLGVGAVAVLADDVLAVREPGVEDDLLARLDDPTKQWKFNPSDLDDRKLWDAYMAAYETALKRCSTDYAPWHVIPADRNWARNAAVSRIVRETLEDMAPQYPPPKDWDPKTVVVT